MLIKFSVENWRCFKDKATINLTATNERQHKERLPAVGKYRMMLLGRSEQVPIFMTETGKSGPNT